MGTYKCEFGFEDRVRRNEEPHPQAGTRGVLSYVEESDEKHPLKWVPGNYIEKGEFA